MFMRKFNRFLAAATIAASILPTIAFAQQAVFTDIPAGSPVAAAAEYLASKGIVQMATKFNPDGKLTRAQAAKILVAPLVGADQLAKITKSGFADVPAGSWYLPYAEAAKSLGIVDAAANFNPEKPVTKAAFIKMLLKSKGIDAASTYSEFKLPLATDVSNTSDWSYPFIRYALASTMTAVGKEGLLNPAGELTRASMALLYYRLDMYLAGKRTQAGLSQTETDITNVLQMLDAKSTEQAEYAAARAVLSARGALALKPDEPLVKGAVKISEGFQSLTLAYKSGIAGNLEAVVQYAKDAYASAEKAKAFSPGLTSLATQMQTIGKSMADEARKLMAQAQPPK
jgi:hypothetical protein